MKNQLLTLITFFTLSLSKRKPNKKPLKNDRRTLEDEDDYNYEPRGSRQDSK